MLQPDLSTWRVRHRERPVTRLFVSEHNDDRGPTVGQGRPPCVVEGCWPMRWAGCVWCSAGQPLCTECVSAAALLVPEARRALGACACSIASVGHGVSDTTTPLLPRSHRRLTVRGHCVWAERREEHMRRGPPGVASALKIAIRERRGSPVHGV